MTPLRFKQKGSFAALSVSVLILVIVSCDGGGNTVSPPSPSVGVLIENNDDVARSPQIVMDDKGTAIVVWEQFDFSRLSAWTNRFDGTAWGTAELIETDNVGSGIGNLQIATDGIGTAFAVWEQQSDNTHHNIWVKRFDGTAWGTAEQIETTNIAGVHYVRDPQIAMDNNGRAIVLWRQWDDSRFNHWIKRFDGVAWDTAERLETYNAGSVERPRIAMDPTGSAIVVWQQLGSIFKHIWANRFDGVAWGTAELIETATVGDALSPQIVMDDTGSAIAAWYQYDGIRNNLWANRFDGTAWGTAALIETDNAGSVTGYQIAMDGIGTAVAVWAQTDGTRNNLWANRFDGAAWGTAELIETDNTGDARNFQIAMDGTGVAIVLWSQYNGTRHNIWANHFDGAAWGTADLIENSNDDASSVPEIAMDSTGTAFAVWEQYDGTRWNPYVNHFDGTAWGTAERIETDGEAGSLQIAMDGTGIAIVVMQQEAAGNQYDIWAYRFE